MTRRRCPTEDGGPMKMELPRLESPHPDNGGPLKLQTEYLSYRGSAAEMDRTGKSSISIAAGAIAVWIGQEKSA